MRTVLFVCIFASTTAFAIQRPAKVEQASVIASPIVTTLYFSDGSFQQNRGNGFVMGEQYFTAYHNIQSDRRVIRKVITLGGIEVYPNRIDEEHDLALFDVPHALCDLLCNQLSFEQPNVSGLVTWIHDIDNIENEKAWRSGSIQHLIYKSAVRNQVPSGCEENLVVEIDVPFYPGNSGGPVFDKMSGVVVGLIQGSFERRNGNTTGYYKPVECILQRLDPVQLARVGQ